MARVELMDMLCMKLGLPQTRTVYEAMNCLDWTFGQKMKLANGITYWATDSRYTFGDHNSASGRRDMFLLLGTPERVRITLANGRRERKDTVLCCEACCFVSIAHLDQLVARTNHQLPEPLLSDVTNNTLTYVLGR